jgi:SAM-dependent methyltransferase
VAAADAVALPIRSHRASLAISFMVLQDVDDLNGVLAETARALAAGGRLCFSVIHPIASSGDFVDDDTDSDFLVHLPYAETRRFQEAVTRDGLTMTFHSEHRPLEVYVDALTRVGFVVEALREPVPDAAVVADVPRLQRQRLIPWYLHVRARRDA